MKSTLTLLAFLLMTCSVQAQKNDIKTFSVSIGEFINFVAENYEQQIPEEENQENRNIVFLIQVANAAMSLEDQILLKQGFKLLAQRLNDQNTLSIITYYGYNGVALETVLPSEIAKINNVIIDPKSHINEFHEDGIELAYSHVNTIFDHDMENSIVIVRNTNAADPDIAALSKKEIKKLKNKKKKKEILKVAVSILPELIAILKN